MASISIAALLVIAGLIWFIDYAVKQYSQVNENWIEYTNTEANIFETVFELNSLLGYGGMIHDFKNYVIRAESKYLSLLKHDFSGIRLKLDKLEHHLSSNTERQALVSIRMTIEEYAYKIDIAKEMHSKGANINEIDRIVKVNDEMAFQALNIIRQETVKRSLAMQKETDVAMNIANNNLALARLIAVPMMLFTLLLLLYYIRRVQLSNDDVERANKWVNTLLDTAPEAMICVNLQGEIVRSNNMAEKLFGYSDSEFLNMKVEQLIPDRFAHMHMRMREIFFAEPSIRPMGTGRELYAKLKNGKELKVEISLSMAGDSMNKVTIATIRDITEREANRQETELAKNHAELALMQLEEAKDYLVESEKMAALGELVAGIAHEINTPIGNALASATFIYDQTVKVSGLYDDKELCEDDLEEYFSHSSEATRLIAINLERAADLINSFKRVAVDQTGGESRSFALDEYMRETLLSIKPVIRKTKITVHHQCDKDLTMTTYPGALSQCLTNLVVNAIIHGFEAGEEGYVSITAVSNDDCDKVVISVTDDGKGIPESLHKKIFEPFFSTKRSAGGSGLGLQIVYNLVTHNLGGKITLESAKGEGTTFRLELPREFKLNTQIY